MASANRYKKIISQRKVIEGSINKLEEQVFALQDAQAAHATVRELQAGNEALKALREEGGLNAEEASEVLSNSADELSELQAVNDLIADRSENEMSNEDLDNFLAEHAEKNLAGLDSGGTPIEPSEMSVEDLGIFPAEHLAENDTLAAAFLVKGSSTYEVSRMLPSVPMLAPKNLVVMTAGLVQPVP